MVAFKERLKELRSSSNMTQEDLAAKMEVSKGTIGNYETGRRAPDPETLELIADIFNVDVDYLLGRTNTLPVFNLEEKWIIDCYRETDDDIKTAIKTILRKYSEEKPIAVEEKKTKIIPLFCAAAGPGEPPSQDGFEDYEVDEDSPARFAVKISGDSMEPEFHDGDIVLCRKKRPEIGEIAVMMVDGFIYVKQYIEGINGFYLRSLNRKRKDCDLDVLYSGGQRVEGYGTVIHKKIPLVMQ